MFRLFILALPLILICVVFHTSWESDVVMEEDERLGRSEVGRDFSGRAGEGARVSKNAYQMESIGALGKKQSRSAALEKLEPKSLSGRSEVRESGVEKLEEVREPLVEKVIAQIPAELLGALSEDDLTLLRSYTSGLISPNSREQPWLCWGPDVSEDKVEAFHEAERLSALASQGVSLFANQFLGRGNWSRTATDGFTGGIRGNPVTVTWSIVPDNTILPGLGSQALAPSDFREWMASIYGGSETAPPQTQVWFTIIEDAFEAMADVCGINLVYEPNDDGSSVRNFEPGQLGVRGDIRVGARALDGNGGTLAFAFAPDSGDIVFDSGDAVFNNTASDSIILFNVTTHEVGHSLGLDHVCPLNRTKLMEPFINSSFRGPQFDEFQSLQRLYGDPLERGQAALNNDSVARASALNIIEDVELRMPRLSIDGGADVDFFRIRALEGQRLSVTLLPGEGTYLEGGETRAGCSNGTSFRSNEIQDLRMAIIGPDGFTVLQEVNAGGLGIAESLTRFLIESDGDYFLRVSGDSSDAAQLYQVNLTLGDRVPGSRIELGDGVVLAESGVVKNGRLDPNETLRFGIDMENEGGSVTGALRLNVTASSNVTVFSSEIPPMLGARERGRIEIVFAGLGECGDLANLRVEVLDDAGPMAVFEQEFLMGEMVFTERLGERFDASSDLPDTWSSSVSGNGELWRTSSSRFVSPLRSAFVEGVSSVSEVFLISPDFVLNEGGEVLSFEHFFDIEDSFDGGLLEVSRNGGGWVDLIESPEVVVTGGYNRLIRNGFSSAIAGRNAWSGRTPTFQPVRVEFPLAWVGDSLRLRWRVVHDSSASGDGWWVDNVRVETVRMECEEHRPVLNLALVGGGLDENDLGTPVMLSLSSELPLGQDLEVSLSTEGTASLDDFDGDLVLTIAAGEQSVQTSLTVSEDDLVEGEETLNVIIPDGDERFAPGTSASQTLTIFDEGGVTQWQGQFFGGGVPLEGDSDGDGLSEIAEYLLGTDPTSNTSRVSFSLRQEGTGFLMPLRDLPERSDATLGVEFSDNLTDWLPGSFEVQDEGLFFDISGERMFLRLSFSLDE